MLHEKDYRYFYQCGTPVSEAEPGCPLFEQGKTDLF